MVRPGEELKRWILEDVTLDREHRDSLRSYNIDPERGGFLSRERRDSGREWVTDYAGFCVPLVEHRAFFPPEVTPRVDYTELPRALQTWAHTNRGVGPRVYNIPEAYPGTTEDFDRAGLYRFTLPNSGGVIFNQLHEARGNEVIRAAGQILSLIDFATDGGETFTFRKHAYYDIVPTVLFGETLSSQRLRETRGAPPPLIPVEFFVIRSAQVRLTRLGIWRRKR